MRNPAKILRENSSENSPVRISASLITEQPNIVRDDVDTEVGADVDADADIDNVVS